jgi:hypothetical protein
VDGLCRGQPRWLADFSGSAHLSDSQYFTHRSRRWPATCWGATPPLWEFIWQGTIAATIAIARAVLYPQVRYLPRGVP